LDILRATNSNNIQHTDVFWMFDIVNVNLFEH